MAKTSTTTTTSPKPTGATLRAFLKHHRGMGQRLFAVADAARDRELAFAAQERFSLPRRHLFADNVAEHMKEVAPYLIAIDAPGADRAAGEGYLDLWADRLGGSAGILLLAAADPARLHIHLRGVFRAIDANNRQFYFRFYDPRVLRPFLPSCGASETRAFFGPVERIVVEAEAAGHVLVCKPAGDRVEVLDTPLAESGPAGRAPGRTT